MFDSNTRTVEQAFIEELFQRIDDKQSENTQAVISFPLDREDYLRRVGYIQALKDVKEDVERLLKAYFPT